MVTQALVGYAMARAVAGPRGLPARVAAAAVLLPVVPDLDVLLVPWFGFCHPLGHRGISHSLAFAVALGLLAAAASRPEAGVVRGGTGGLAALFVALACGRWGARRPAAPMVLSGIALALWVWCLGGFARLMESAAAP